MNLIKCEVGIWQAEARIKEIGDRTRIAIISATAGRGDSAIHSMHTIVFDRTHGTDEEEAVKSWMRKVFLNGQ